MADFAYYNDQELPVATFDLSALGEDFSTGWTFSVRLCRANAPTTTVLLKTTGITSTATTVTVAWSTTDWSGLVAALPPNGTDYVGYLYCRRTSDSKDLERQAGRPFTLKLMAAAGTTPPTAADAVWPWTVDQPINSQTGTTYTLVTGDMGKLVTLDNGSAVTVTVDASTALSAGERIDLAQLGAGQVTVAASGVTVNATPGLKLRARYSAATLLCVSSGVYLLVGDLSA